MEQVFKDQKGLACYEECDSKVREVGRERKGEREEGRSGSGWVYRSKIWCGVEDWMHYRKKSMMGSLDQWQKDNPQEQCKSARVMLEHRSNARWQESMQERKFK